LHLQVLISMIWRSNSSVFPINGQDILIKLYLQGAIFAFLSVCSHIYLQTFY
jgi:nitrite reductase/ring-hydroxylating ferredoxin subunit